MKSVVVDLYSSLSFLCLHYHAQKEKRAECNFMSTDAVPFVILRIP